MPPRLEEMPRESTGGDVDRWVSAIRQSLDRIQRDLRRVAELGVEDPSAAELLQSIEESRRSIAEARDELAELGQPLPAVRVDFERDRTVPGSRVRLVLRNTGDAPLHVRGLAVVSARPADVPLQDGCSGATLPPGEACFIEPRFDPAELRIGWAELELNHDGQPIYTVPVPGVDSLAARDAPEEVGPSELESGLEPERVVIPPPRRPRAEPPRPPPPPPPSPETLPPPTTATPTPTPTEPEEPRAGPAVPAPAPAETPAAGEAATITLAVLGALLLALIVAAAVFVAAPSAFQLKVFNTTLAAGAALVITAVVRASELPDRAIEAAGARFAGFAAQGASALVAFLLVYFGQPLQRFGLATAGSTPTPALPVRPMARCIFISYRRSTTADVTGRIHEHLSERYGDEAVFRDVEDISLGVDFRQTLMSALGECKIVLAVIGPEWAGKTDSEEHRRLDNPADFVRIELESALRRRLPLIPLLVQGASMPSAERLPASLEGLAFRNGMPVRPDPDFANDMRRLIAEIDKILAGN